jgi:heat shock protein HslJ
MRTFVRYILTAIAAVGLLAGCAVGGEPVIDPLGTQEDSSKEAENMPVSQEELASVVWSLLAYGQAEDLQSLAPDTEVTLQFDTAAGQINGFSSCNRYFGGASIDPENGSLAFGPIGMTRMSCGSPINEQEAVYIAILQTAERLVIEDERLVVFAADDQVLVFSPGPAVE